MKDSTINEKYILNIIVHIYHIKYDINLKNITYYYNTNYKG